MYGPGGVPRGISAVEPQILKGRTRWKITPHMVLPQTEGEEAYLKSKGEVDRMQQATA